MKNRLAEEQIELYAWIGEDELGSGKVGLKQARVPAGMIPIVAIDRSKVDQEYIIAQLELQARMWGRPIKLVRFEMVEVLKEIQP